MNCSILIPCKNSSIYITETLSSCLEQGDSCVKEIIVVDDNSEDQSREVVLRFANQNQRVPVILVSNRGSGAARARNTALELARGDFVQWLDSDDILGLEKIRRAINVLKGSRDALAVCRWIRFTGEFQAGAFSAPTGWFLRKSTYQGTEWLTSRRTTAIHAWLGARELFRQAGPWNSELLINQDGEYMARVLSRAKHVIYDRDSLVYYRSQVPGSTSNQMRHKDASLLLSIQLIEDVIRGLEFPHNSRDFLAHSFARVISASYPRSPLVSARALSGLRQYGLDRAIYRHLSSTALARRLQRQFGWRGFLWLQLLRRLVGSWGSTLS